MTAQASKSKSIWDGAIARRAIWDSFIKLNPVTLMKNPVMFVVEIGAALLTVELVSSAAPISTTNITGFFISVTGFSFMNESHIARRAIAPSQIDLLLLA